MSPVFTANQRRSMEKKIGQLVLSEPFVFVTLTYAENWTRCPAYGFPTNPAVYTNDLRRFLDRLVYKNPAAGVIWRLEYQNKRGAPHNHMAIYGLPDDSVKVIRDELAQMWTDVTETSEDDKAFVRSVEAERPAGVNAKKARLGYMAKRDPRQLSSPYITHEGRFWGTKAEKNLPFATEMQLDLTEKEAHKVRRAMRAHANKTSKRRIRAYPHNPTFTLRRGCASDHLRYANYVIDERTYVDTATGEVMTGADLEEAQTPCEFGRQVPGRAEANASDHGHGLHGDTVNVPSARAGERAVYTAAAVSNEHEHEVATSHPARDADDPLQCNIAPISVQAARWVGADEALPDPNSDGVGTYTKPISSWCALPFYVITPPRSERRQAPCGQSAYSGSVSLRGPPCYMALLHVSTWPYALSDQPLGFRRIGHGRGPPGMDAAPGREVRHVATTRLTEPSPRAETERRSDALTASERVYYLYLQPVGGYLF